MPYLQKGRLTWWGSFYSLAGQRRRVSLNTSDPRSAGHFERVLRQIAERPEWHDVLDALVLSKITMPEVYHAFAKSDIAGLRTHLLKSALETTDTALETLLPQWESWLVSVCRMAPEGILVYQRKVKNLLARRHPFRVSHLTAFEMQDWYADLMGRMASQTARSYGVALGSFIRFLMERGVLRTNPVRDVARPKKAEARTRHLEWGEVQALITAVPQSTRAQRTIRDCIAICYGAGAEVSAALTLSSENVRQETREVYLTGTKNRHRARWVRVADWCWPTIERRLEGAKGRLFAPLGIGPNTRAHVSRVHLATARKLGMTNLTLHDARHTFAVRLLQAGTPVEVVSRQLGHADSSMVVKVYGRWVVSAGERNEWEKRAAARWELATA